MKSGALTFRLGRAALVASTTLLAIGAVAGVAHADAGVSVSVDPASWDYGHVTIGTPATKTFTVTSTGSVAAVFGTATITGTNASVFTITDDNCSTVTVDPTDTCTVTVSADAFAVGPLSATLDLAVNTDAGHALVNLTGNAIFASTGTYYPVTPARILDTRDGTGAPAGPVGPGGVVHLQVTGQGGVAASGVSAVVLNVTVTGPTAQSFLSVYPTGSPRPTVSNLNFPKGFTGANNVTVPVGTGGQVDLYNLTGNVQVLADVLGFYAADDSVIGSLGLGGELYSGTPIRLADTRDVNLGGPNPVGPGEDFEVAYDLGDLNPHIKAFAVNITAVSPTASGFLTGWSGTGNRPNASTLNFTKGAVVPNLAIVPTGSCDIVPQCAGAPAIDVYNSNGNTHVVVDLVGFYDDGTLGGGLLFHPVNPTRITDSRVHLGLSSALGAKATGTVTTPNTVRGVNTAALSANVTAVQPTVSTFLTVWPNGETRPTASTVNAAKGAIVPNAAIVPLSAAGKFNIYNNSGTTNVLVDVSGTFDIPANVVASGLRVSAVGPAAGKTFAAIR